MVMGDTAEVVAKRYKVSRLAQDEYSLESQKRTARAQQECFFAGEIAPMQTTKAIYDKKTGEKIGEEPATCDRDECNRPDTTLEGLLALKPHFDPNSGEGSVTAGNASQLSDGASATLLMSRERADALGIPYKLIFRGFAVAGCEPDEMGIGPVFAVPKLLKRQGPEDVRHRSVGAERSVRGAGGLLPRPARDSAGDPQRQRRLHRDRPSVRHDRIAHGGHDRE